MACLLLEVRARLDVAGIAAHIDRMRDEAIERRKKEQPEP
jgi:hypothetical protein